MMGTREAPRRTRLDVSLVQRGLVESRARAQALILAGKVFAGERRLDKAGEQVDDAAELTVRGQDHPWVSRGGLKLDHALRGFGLSPAGRVCLDIGASTGGFTDVLLQAGAARVHAVDVGHGQLAWALRSDPRVVVHERTNARHLTEGAIGEAVALIKPQFEAGPAQVGSKGVVRDPAVHAEVCARIVAWWGGLPGWRVLGVEASPITGPEGNREFLAAACFS
jgi:23S rRNA (cytidine1920-2'-O)/16S rRNA (cytidine1409-2'-O)-methyltransferase